MIAIHIMGGIGNQLFQYAFAKAVALKNNAELKLEISECEYSKFSHHNYYRLGDFNIEENFATADEVKNLKVIREDDPNFSPALLENADNILLYGYWQKIINDLSDEMEKILRREITPKNPFGRTAEFWKQKILSVECAVSLHIRHGDYLSPLARNDLGILPMDYYVGCIAKLKKDFPNLTVFVFSDDLNWVKKNFKLDVPMEFVEGCEKDVEELFLMSYCKHNIIANSTFSRWGGWLNQNPNKKVFMPFDISKFPISDANNRPMPKNFIDVPVDYTKRGHVDFPPMLSLILYVTNDVETIQFTLKSILGQHFKDYELIIIDASTDDSGKICRSFAKFENVSVYRESSSTDKFQAWNRGLKIARGDYVMFIDGKTIIFPDAFVTIARVIYVTVYETKAGKVQSYSHYENYNEFYPNIICTFRQCIENNQGGIQFQNIPDKKFLHIVDTPMKDFNRITTLIIDDVNKCMALANKSINNSLGTKIFKRVFLKKFGIGFNEFSNRKDSTLQFLINAFMCTKEIVFVPDIFCGKFN